MKKLIFCGLLTFFATPWSSAQMNLPFLQMGFDTCYSEARNSFYSIEKASGVCKGVISSSCYIDARRNFMSIERAAQACQGFISNTCYEDARMNFAPIDKAAALCQMIIPPGVN
jgi:hypothetical protein